LVAELKSMSGTDSRILDDPDALRMILPPTRSDYRAVETYRYQPGPALSCPVVVLVGADDPKVDDDEAEAWAEHTTGPFALHTFPGGHFYFAEHQQGVVDVITGRLLSPAR
jgi:pyochelin biosynthetic protein PchC